MKNLVLFGLLFLTTVTFAQQLKLTPKMAANGFKYPVAAYEDKDIESKINASLLEQVQPLIDNDFCVGEYGYVQKGSHIEIHIFANCIDFAESQHYYLLFNLDNGNKVAHSDLFVTNQQENALKYIKKQVDAYTIGDGECGESWKGIQNQDLTYDSINIRLNRDGIEVRPAETTTCEKGAIIIPWSKLSSFLRYKFI